MAMRSNPWYNSQVLAQVGNNLAAAIYGDPDAKYKQNQDVRAERNLMLQQKRVGLEESRFNAQQEQLQQQQAAITALGDILGPEAMTALQAGLGDTTAFSLMGPENPLVLADQHKAAYRDQLVDENRKDANELAVALQQQRDQSADRRQIATMVAQLARAGMPSRSSRSAAPTKFTTMDDKRAQDALGSALEQLAGGEYVLDESIGPGALGADYANAYQANPNAAAALSSVLEGVEAVPDTNWMGGRSDNDWIPFNEDPTTIRRVDGYERPQPPQPGIPQAAGGMDPQTAQALQEGMEALNRGVDPEVVMKRLIEFGVDPSLLGGG